MKYLLYLTLVALLSVGISAQTLSKSDEAAAMKKAVRMIIAAKKKPNVDVVLRDLRELEGKIVAVYDDSFVVKFKEKHDRGIPIITVGNVPRHRKPPMMIKYGDVLQIRGKDVVLSFVPDPKLTNYSEWNAISTVGVGALLQIHTHDGKKENGVLTTWTDDRIKLMQGNTEIKIARNDIVRVYQLAGDARTMTQKVSDVGRKVGTIADALLVLVPFTIYAALVHPALGIGVAAATAAGIVMYVLPKDGVKRVLLYAT
jgi:hypothetical protein